GLERACGRLHLHLVPERVNRLGELPNHQVAAAMAQRIAGRVQHELGAGVFAERVRISCPVAKAEVLDAVVLDQRVVKVERAQLDTVDAAAEGALLGGVELRGEAASETVVSARAPARPQIARERALLTQR